MIARRTFVAGPLHAKGCAKHRARTVLVWRRERVAAALGFLVGVLSTVLAIRILDIALGLA